MESIDTGLSLVTTEAGCDGEIHVVKTSLKIPRGEPHQRFIEMGKCNCRKKFPEIGKFDWEPPAETGGPEEGKSDNPARDILE